MHNFLPEWQMEASELHSIVDMWRRLQPHFATDSVYFVGGVCIRRHLGRAGISIGRGGMSNVDIAVTSPEAVLPSIGRSEFLVVHIHEEKYGRYTALIDKQTRRKLNIHPARHHYPPAMVPALGQMLRIQDAQNQYVSTVQDTCKILKGQPVDPKQFADATKLEQALNATDEQAATITAWQQRHTDGSELPDMLRAITNVAGLHPNLAKPRPYRGRQIRSLVVPCAECSDVPGIRRVSTRRAAFAHLTGM